MRNNTSPAPRLLDRNALKQIVPYSHSQIDRLEKLGKFPSRQRLGARRVAWRECEITEWIEGLPRGFGDNT